MLVRAEDPQICGVTLAAPVPILSRTPAEVHHTGRPVGADTGAILAEVAEMAKDEIDELQAD